MTRKLRIGTAFVAAAILFATSAPHTARAALAPGPACVVTIAKEAGKFVKGKLKTIQKCNNANLKSPGSCLPGDLAASIAKLEGKMGAGIDKKCASLNNAGVQLLGFPGKCDGTVGAFTATQLRDCQIAAHEELVDQLIDIEYGGTTGTLDKATLTCQSGLAAAGAAYVNTYLKIIQKCRNDLLTGKSGGYLPSSCESVGKNPASIAKAVAKLTDSLAKKCPDNAVIANLDACDPPADTLLDLTTCIEATHRERVFNTDPTSPADMIDFEYAEQPICGDNVVNQLDEECDGADDSDCPTQCGAADGNFPCLCLDKKRQRAIEHEDADLENGWTGKSHDSSIVEGGGFVVDLYECDGVGDNDCIMGPNCSGAPHSPCSNDAQCALLGQGTCRKERTAVGPHCELDIQVACTADGTPTDSACTGPGNFCKQQFHGPPLPLSSAGTSVCVVNVFSEDIVGTTNLATGSSAFRLRQSAITHLAQGSINQPCPVCGGFCRGNAMNGPGERIICDEDSDCPTTSLGPPLCVTDAICSFGPNANKPCRRTPPYGNSTELFGTPSVDCPPNNNISGATGLDVLFNPASTGSVSVKPTFACNSAGYGGKACVSAGSPLDLGKPCTVDGDCPGGGSGACSNQCFCPSGGGVAQRPNECEPACVSSDGVRICVDGPNTGDPCTTSADCGGGTCANGPPSSSLCVSGANDGLPCVTALDCPGGVCTPPYDRRPCSNDSDCTDGGSITGFCHLGDCRLDAADGDSNQEGSCTVGPSLSSCSFTTIKACGSDLQCRSPGCTFCRPANECVGGTSDGDPCTLDTDCPGGGTCGEKCLAANQQCFIPTGIERIGGPGVPDRVTAAIFCLPATTSAAVNSTAGLPGPGALLTPATVVTTGF